MKHLEIVFETHDHARFALHSLRANTEELGYTISYSAGDTVILETYEPEKLLDDLIGALIIDPTVDNATVGDSCV